MSAPLGRRLCAVTQNRSSGGYRVFSLRDEEGGLPEAGQFYMLATESGWERGGGRPFLPRALSVADADADGEAVRLDFLIEGVGPGTERLCELEEGERVWVNGPLGNAFSDPTCPVAGRRGGDPRRRRHRNRSPGSAPTPILRSQRPGPGPARISRRGPLGGLEDLFACCEVRLASDDGHAGHRGYVTDLLAAMLEGDDAASAVVYSCGPPAMLETVRAICAGRGVACELALESPMACGFGACFGCAVPLTEGGYMRLCVDGPVVAGERIAAVTHA